MSDMINISDGYVVSIAGNEVTLYRNDIYVNHLENLSSAMIKRIKQAARQNNVTGILDLIYQHNKL